MLTQEQKRQMIDLMAELPKYVDEVSARSALSDLASADEATWRNLHHVIFVKKNWPRYNKHPSVCIMRFFGSR